MDQVCRLIVQPTIELKQKGAREGQLLKRQSPERALRRARVGKARHLRHLRRQHVLDERRAIKALPDGWQRFDRSKKMPAGYYQSPRSAKAVPVPPDFDVRDEKFLGWIAARYRGTGAFLTHYQKRKAEGRRVKRTRGLVYSDFAMIKRMTPAAALVVAALYDRHRTLSDSPMYVYNLPDWKPEVRDALVRIGFFDILGLPPNKVFGVADPVTRIERFNSGAQLATEELGQLIERLLDYLMAAHPDCLTEDETAERTMKLYSALVEATENTRRHAYPQDFQDSNPVMPNWWLTGAITAAERKVTLVVYDQGISIPGSLASDRKSQWAGHSYVNRVLKRFAKGTFDDNDPASDHAKIRLAMRHGWTSTSEAHRGKGLPVVREAISHCRRGVLHILSRYGAYREETGRRPESWHLSSPMPGTLVIWDLWL